jgi:cAMP-dependent protein kinase regulator
MIFSSRSFVSGQMIVKQGDVGESFFIIEEGTATAKVDGVEVMKYSTKDYFGELALLKNLPRAATVEATSTPCKVLSLDRRSFIRLLGNIEDLMRKHAEKNYNQKKK